MGGARLKIPAIVDFSAPSTPVAAPIDPARILAGSPQPSVDNRYSDPSQRFHCGTWASAPGRWQVSYTEQEFCYLLRGRVRLVASDGAVKEFAAGAAFVIPAGFVGTWETIEPAEKHYVVLEPG